MGLRDTTDMPNAHTWRGPLAALGGLIWLGLGIAMLTGCANTGTVAMATCLDDSQNCISQRKTSLDGLMADTSRNWIQHKPSPVVYATGVRLFAYRKTQSQLSCNELAAGIAETGSARSMLAGGINGASKTRIGQIIALSDDVNAELKRTARGKRCKTA